MFTWGRELAHGRAHTHTISGDSSRNQVMGKCSHINLFSPSYANMCMKTRFWGLKRSGESTHFPGSVQTYDNTMDEYKLHNTYR